LIKSFDDVGFFSLTQTFVRFCLFIRNTGRLEPVFRGPNLQTAQDWQLAGMEYVVTSEKSDKNRSFLIVENDNEKSVADRPA
jgi:hypothetical protein